MSNNNVWSIWSDWKCAPYWNGKTLYENSHFQVLCSRLHITGIYLWWSDLKNKICQVAKLKWNSIKHVSSVLCLLFIEFKVEVPVAGYLGFQLVNISCFLTDCTCVMRSNSHSTQIIRYQEHIAVISKKYIFFPHTFYSLYMHGKKGDGLGHFADVCVAQRCTKLFLHKHFTRGDALLTLKGLKNSAHVTLMLTLLLDVP